MDNNVKTLYEKTMSEWLAVEAIVRQREKEAMAANILKNLSSESTDMAMPGPFTRGDSSLSNDVFESLDEWDNIMTQETVVEESSTTGTTCTPTTDRKQSLELHLQGEIITVEEQVSHNMVLNKKDYVCKSFSESPDDGLGDSIAPHTSQERAKLDSAGDSEGTDISKGGERDGSLERMVHLTKLSCSIDSAEADVEDVSDDSDEGSDDEDSDEESSDHKTTEDITTKPTQEPLSTGAEILHSLGFMFEVFCLKELKFSWQFLTCKKEKLRMNWCTFFFVFWPLVVQISNS
jgi:hypothetical protein